MTQTQDSYDAQMLMRVLEVARQLAAPHDLRELLGQVVEAGRAVFTADRGTVFLFDQRRRELYSVVATGQKEIRFGVEHGIAGQCARNREVINVLDAYADRRFNPAIDKKTGYRTRSLITFPLVGLEDQLVGVMQLLNPKKGCFTEQDEKLAQVLAAQAAAAIQRTQLIEDRLERLRLQRDLDVARDIQQRVLPEALPQRAGYQIAARSDPADETGGDIYDATDTPAGHGPESPLLLVLGDATGHGIGAALSVTQFLAMTRLALRLGASLDALLHQVNAQLCEDLGGRRFVTAFLGLLDPTTHQVRYHAPGQGPLLHYVAATGEAQLLRATTVPLGVIEEPPMFHVEPIYLAQGDVLALLTDGFYEQKALDGQMFGEERVIEVVRAHADESAQQITDALFNAWTRFSHGQAQSDDLTALVLKRTADGTG